jgi:hypothetical protein
MDIITTHINADFDCLGSMIAARRLYPEAEMVFPGGQERSLREFFLKSAQYAFGFKRVRDVELERIDRLILVDVRQASRIGPFAEVARRPGVELHIFDHHPAKPGDLTGTFELIELVGSTVTVLAHQPSGTLRASSTAQRVSFIHGCSSTKVSHAHSVPTMPGAFGLRPEPNPKASTCAGCASMKRAFGRTGASVAATSDGGFSGKKA